MPPFVHRLRVRYHECDQQNAVFNANYLTYCDVAYTELWREALGTSYDDATKDMGVDVVVAEANVRYFAPARFDDELELRLEVERLGTTAITTRFDFQRGEELLAQARLRHVIIAVGEGTKTQIPDSLREAMRPYAATDAEITS